MPVDVPGVRVQQRIIGDQVVAARMSGVPARPVAIILPSSCNAVCPGGSRCRTEQLQLLIGVIRETQCLLGQCDTANIGLLEFLCPEGTFAHVVIVPESSELGALDAEFTDRKPRGHGITAYSLMNCRMSASSCCW